jgi:PAS domain S-box-containing protein
VLAWLDTLRANYQYASVSLADAAGREQLTSGDRLSFSRDEGELARQAAAARGVVFHEIPGTGARRPHLALAIALRHEDRDDLAVFGTVVLTIDPAATLDSVILRWPLARPTSEVVLRWPGEARDVPDGREGVLTASARVPGSPWMIVSKIDAAEAFAPLAQTRRQVLLVGGMLTLLCAISLGFIFYKQRYEAAAERQALRGHYDYLTRYASDALVLMDGNGRLLEVNDRAVEMYGCTRDELLLMTVRDLRSDAARPQFGEQWEIIRASGSLVFDTEHQRRNGRAFPVEISTRVVRVGAELFRQSTIRDITERKRAETALAEQDAQRRRAEDDLRVSRDRLERVLDSMDEGYWDRNVVTGDVHVSPRWYTMLGYLPGEISFDWQSWIAMAHPEDRPLLEASVAKAEDTAGGVPFAFEFRLRCKSGQYIWVRSRGKTVERDAGGRPVRRVGTVSDITERKKLEAQFLQAQKLESGGRLAGAVAHDFNNLLTIINGYSDLVISQMDLGGPFQKHLQAIRDAGQRAAALTEQLLTFSRKQVVQPRVVGVNATVEDVGDLLRRMAGDEVRVGIELRASPDCVLADPTQLHQVLMNLVVNARDAMPMGGSLIIETANADIGRDEAPDAEPGPHLRISVRDTGVGMTEETRGLMFEPFFTTKERGKGTGLGLSTVYGIVRQSGGFIRVESERGAGTTFHVYFPITADTRAGAPPVFDAPRLTRGSETILLVENEEAVRALAVEALTSLGYDVLAARDGIAALRRAATHRGHIDLLLSDLSMPGMDGTTLAERLTAVRPETKVLYMTGRAGPADADYVAKPFTRRTLGAAVRAALGPAPHAEPPSGPLLLVVDDDESVRGLVPELLQDRYDVLLAADGAEAVQIVRRTPSLKVVLTDLFMPNMEGFEMIKVVRALRPDVRIIAMSGAFGGEFLAGAERAGVDGTLRKPIDQKTLRRTLDGVLTTSGLS